MFDYDTEINLDQELSEIPPEYQDAFRQTIEQELADTEQNRTDTDILTYMRQRRDDFKRGSFIRPDGRPGMVALNPETMYEQALPELQEVSGTAAELALTAAELDPDRVPLARRRGGVEPARRAPVLGGQRTAGGE